MQSKSTVVFGRRVRQLAVRALLACAAMLGVGGSLTPFTFVAESEECSTSASGEAAVCHASLKRLQPRCVLARDQVAVHGVVRPADDGSDAWRSLPPKSPTATYLIGAGISMRC